jgi:hypothetical protein
MAVGQAGTFLYSRTILQAYYGTKRTIAYCSSYDGFEETSVAKFVWYKKRGKDKYFLLNAPLSPSGLFSDAVTSIVDRFIKNKYIYIYIYNK